uniref:Uncharacterized protein n=1 Tax=Lepeophtheirus salmonis TaxID=72036 RepID=A0A0K2T9W7_LEPSM
MEDDSKIFRVICLFILYSLDCKAYDILLSHINCYFILYEIILYNILKNQRPSERKIQQGT